jgi:hypothetical protein
MQACKLVPSSFGKVANGKEGRDPNFGNVGFNPLKPVGHYMYGQFSIQQFYGLPTQCICVFCVDLRTNSRWKENTDLLTFKNRASYIQDGRTATLQMLHFIYIFFSTNISTEYFKHAAHSPLFSSKCRLFYNATFFGSCIIHILHTGCAKIWM